MKSKKEWDEMEEAVFGNYQSDHWILDVPFVESPPEKIDSKKAGPRPNPEHKHTLTLQLTRNTIWKFRALYAASSTETYEDFLKSEVIPSLKKWREMEDQQ